jgi:DNA polymerase
MKEPYNGLPPFVAGVDTSEAAAQSMAGDASQLREFVFSVIHGSGAGGMTCDEVEVDTGMRHQTVSARIRELQQRGRLVDSARRRPTRSGRPAIVWVTEEVVPETVSVSETESGTLFDSSMTNQPSLFMESVLNPFGEDGLAPLRKKCLACNKCELALTRTKVVFGEGKNVAPDICFIGEAPGQQEDEEGRPFIGPAGRMLTKIIEAMGYQRDEVYICNAVNCRPPGNRPPEKHELAACHEYLLGQFRAVRPKTVVALGASAVSAIYGPKASKKKIGDLRGKWLVWEDVPVMPTYHPSYLCRVERMPEGKDVKKLVWTDMQMVLAKLGRSLKTD